MYSHEVGDIAFVFVKLVGAEEGFLSIILAVYHLDIPNVDKTTLITRDEELAIARDAHGCYLFLVD